MSFDQSDLAIIGHWPSTSRMPERYDRSVCPKELLLRNTIVHKFSTGWVPAPAYHIPTTVGGHVRVGKAVGNINVNTKTDTELPLTEPTQPEAEGKQSVSSEDLALVEEENETTT